MRGSTPGRSRCRTNSATSAASIVASVSHTGETYDLVVVGGGMSGLAAAYYFLTSVGRSARVLVLDNHDDFGGHAKRNEFVVDGKLLALNGGTLNIESPLRYNLPSRQLLQGIGVDLDRFTTNNTANRGLYASLGLRSGHFFDKETWGRPARGPARGRRAWRARRLSPGVPWTRCRSRRKPRRTCSGWRTRSSRTTCPGSRRRRRRSVWRG